MPSSNEACGPSLNQIRTTALPFALLPRDRNPYTVSTFSTTKSYTGEYLEQTQRVSLWYDFTLTLATRSSFRAIQMVSGGRNDSVLFSLETRAAGGDSRVLCSSEPDRGSPLTPPSCPLAISVPTSLLQLTWKLKWQAPS